jgi:hypothetical protein
MPRYLLVARDPVDMEMPSPSEMQAIIQRYMDWTHRMRAEGRLRESDKLKDGEGRVVRGGAAGKPVVTEGPFAEAREVVGGFWVLEAAHYDELLACLAGHPHLDAPGSLEVREIEELG